MTPGRRALAGLGVGLALAFVLGATARADGAISHQGWASTSAVPTFSPHADRIYVAATSGTESARAAIELREPVAEVVLTQAGDSVLDSTANFAACALVEPLDGDGPLGEVPDGDCDILVEARRAGPDTWRVDLMPFERRWSVSRPFGVVLIARPDGAADTWRMSFDTARTVATPRATAVATDGIGPTPAVVDAPAMPSGNATMTSLPVVEMVTSSSERVGPAAGTPRDRSVAEWPTGASHPSAFVVLPFVGVSVAALLARSRSRVPAERRAAMPGRRSLLAPFALLPAAWLLGDVALYKLGLVVIVFVAAIGLHILVTWTGELSLAHAAFVGAPAFVVANVAASHGISPIHVLPAGVLTGAVLGTAIGLPALRARGLQVALVTMAGAIAVYRFLFTKEWFIGPPGGHVVPDPTIGPVALDSAPSLFAFVVVCAATAVAIAWAISQSKLGRALHWVRADSTAAAAFGISVAVHKLVAYAIAGAFGGLAGGLTVVWVQRLTPGAFPFELSFTYLVIVVLAGRGFVWGVAASAAALEGGRLFVSGADAAVAYGGPVVLLLVLTRFKAGVNGMGVRIMKVVESVVPAARQARRWSLVTGWVAIACGGAAITLAWYHAGNTSEVWIQNQELLSGGIGGLAMVITGVGLLIRDALLAGQEQVLRALGDLRDAAPADTIATDHANGHRAAARPLVSRTQ